MTAEEKREQLLKRILPGLAITIIYFVFVSNILAEKMKKAETEYKALASSGVSKDALPAVASQQGQNQQQLAQVQAKVSELQEQFKKMAGFLSSTGNSANATMAEVSRILDEYDVKQSKNEKTTFPETQLSPALKEVWQTMKPSNNPAAKPQQPASQDIAVHRLVLKGSYIGMYQALTALAKPNLQVLPVSLTMHMPEIDDGNSAEQEWELILWM